MNNSSLLNYRRSEHPRRLEQPQNTTDFQSQFHAIFVRILALRECSDLQRHHGSLCEHPQRSGHTQEEKIIQKLQSFRLLVDFSNENCIVCTKSYLSRVNFYHTLIQNLL